MQSVSNELNMFTRDYSIGESTLLGKIILAPVKSEYPQFAYIYARVCVTKV